jgi:hypothetical protein
MAAVYNPEQQETMNLNDFPALSANFLQSPADKAS